MRDTDIKVNFIRGSDVGPSSTVEDRSADASSDVASRSDDESPTPANISQQLRNLPPEFFKRMYSSSGQKHLLPSEVCISFLSFFCLFLFHLYLFSWHYDPNSSADALNNWVFTIWCVCLWMHIPMFSQAELILEGLWRNEAQLCRLICDIQQKTLNLPGNSKAYVMFFLKALLVPPSKFRPPAFGGHGVSTFWFIYMQAYIV